MLKTVTFEDERCELVLKDTFITGLNWIKVKWSANYLQLSSVVYSDSYFFFTITLLMHFGFQKKK